MSTDAAIIQLDERRLLLRHRAGEAGAFATLVQSYRAPVYSYLLRSGLNRAACDDMFQEIFIKVHTAAASYEADKPLKPWLFAIVVNTVRSQFRKARVEKLVLADTVPEQTSNVARGDEQVEANETAGILERALATLALAEREVILLSVVEQMEQQDVAIALDLPVGTVKTHLHRARAALAKALQRRDVRGEREVSR